MPFGVNLGGLARSGSHQALIKVETRFPEIVCLCGSTRFRDEFIHINDQLTHKGIIVLSVGCFPHAQGFHLLEEVKEELDELHKRKIDLADRVYVINVGGYIGSSTRGEIDYALAHGRPVDYLEPVS